MKGERMVSMEKVQLEKLSSYWAVPLRILFGIAFLAHGVPTITSGAAHAAFAATLSQLGVPAAGAAAWVVGVCATVGGIALIVGAFTAEVSIVLAVGMLAALFLVHLKHGFSYVQIAEVTPEGPRFGLPGIEVNLLYIGGLLSLFLGGPGPASIDERVLSPENRSKPPWLRNHAASA